MLLSLVQNKRRKKKMKKFNATTYKENMIELVSHEALQELYETIDNEENFILIWEEGKIEQSEVIIANNLSAKIKNGDVKLTSKKPSGDR